jgi:hypothetical protein
MNYDELRERVAMGEEFQFYYSNQSYWISKNQNGYYLTRVSDTYTQTFLNANELFENATINDMKIHEIWDEIDI